MSKRIERYPLIDHLENSKEIFASGIIVCIVNLAQLPQELVDCLRSPKENDLEPALLNHFLDKVEIWIVKEKTKKPNENHESMENLSTPPQETRKSNEFFLATIAATIVEEYLPISSFLKNENQLSITYIPHTSYLGHIQLKYPSADRHSKMNQHRADLFLVGLIGNSQIEMVNDSQVEPVGWVTIGEFLSEHYPARRLGSKTIVERARLKLLQFLEQYWNNPEDNQLPLDDAIKKIEARKLQPDFNKRKSAPIVVEATESSPAS